MPSDLGSHGGVTLDYGVALLQTLTMEVSGTRGRYVLATIKHGRLGLTWLIGGPAGQVEANAALIEAVLLGTRVGADLVERETDGSRFIDQRLGYSLEIPAQHQVSAQQIVNVDEGIEVAVWGTPDGRSAVGVLVHPWACTGWTADELVADDKRFFVDLWGPTAAERIASAGDEPGEHLHWDDQPRGKDLVILNRDHTVYMLMVESDEPELFESVRKSFAFVD